MRNSQPVPAALALLLFAVLAIGAGRLPEAGAAGRPAPATVRSPLPTGSRRLPRPTPGCRQRALLPAYFYPGPAWRAELAAVQPGSAIIVNPDSGPGPSRNADYVQVVDAARSKGALLWGYVDTRYGAVPPASLAAQVRAYRRWYGITDIFFDDVSSLAARVGYYRTANRIVRSAAPHASVILNPGDYPAPVYASLGDVLVVFEGDSSRYTKAYPPAWTRRHPPGMFVSLISAVPPSRLGATLALARARRSGWVYVTPHADDSDLYEQLPAYWSAELHVLAAAPPMGPAPTCAV
ncbi:hypothetical protein GHK86_05710 [Acidimicrobiaceae bacterium USS-CC1]|uniref:Spherulation-specific family 4 n=1 Tax=Acidiferrimicrobium australe TaxID=2664430 RepID=A0ABW9QQV6_9ACTN|nr:hypothetical protein [Acidiferrimicrobium australe]